MKIFFTIIILFTATGSWADCNIDKIELGKSFSSLKAKYKMDDDFAGSEKFTSNMKGYHICKELEDVRVSLLFIKDRLVQMQLSHSGEDTRLLSSAISTYGELEKMPNKNDPELKGFSGLWDKKEKVAAYSFSYSGKFNERLTIQGKNYSEDIAKAHALDTDDRN